MRTLQSLSRFRSLFVASLFLPSAAFAQTAISGCQALQSNTHYVLQQSFTATQSPCFMIAGATNVTFDGAGKTVTTNNGELFEFGINSTISNITISSVKSDGSAYFYYPTASNITFKDSTLREINGYGPSYVTVDNCDLKHIDLAGNWNGGITHFTLKNSRVYESLDSTDTAHYVSAYSNQHTIYLDNKNGSADHWVRGDWILTNNIIKNLRLDTFMPNGDAISAITMRSTPFITFTGNTLISGGGYGLYLRDYVSDSTISNNTIDSGTGNAIHVGSGSFPDTVARNQFTDNIFRSASSYALGMMNLGADNVFSRNLFVSGTNLGQYAMSTNNHTTFQNNTFFATGSTEPVKIGWFSIPGHGSDVYRNNIFSFSSSAAINYSSNGLFYSNYYDGNYNLFNKTNGGTPTRERVLDDQNSIDSNAVIFKSTDPKSNDYLRPVTVGAGSIVCTAGQGGTFVGRYSCSSDSLAPAAPTGLTIH